MTAEESTTNNRPDNESRTLAMDRMKEEIEAIAHADAAKIHEEAEIKKKQIIAEANQVAKEIKKKILDEARGEADKNKVREISRKKLAIKMEYLESRESIFDEIIVEAQSQLQKFTKSKEYPSFLEELLTRSAVSIGGGNLLVSLRKEDKNHFTKESLNKIGKTVSDNTGVKTSIEVAKDNLNALGGIKLMRSDKKLFVDNTFESRIERKTESTRVGLLESLS